MRVTATTANKNSNSKSKSKSLSKSTTSSTSTSTSTTTSSSNSSSPADISKHIKSLLKQSTTSNDVRADSARLDELRKVFAKLESSGELVFVGRHGSGNARSGGNARGSSSSSSSNGNDNSGGDALLIQKWNTFLHSSHTKMVEQLCDRIQFSGRHASIRCLWGVISCSPLTLTFMTQRQSTSTSTAASASQAVTGSSTYKILNPSLLKRWMKAMVERQDIHHNHNHQQTSSVSLSTPARMDQGLRHMVESEFLLVYKDVQYYSLTSISSLATETYNNNQQEKNNKDDKDNDDDNDSVDSVDDTQQVVDTTVVADRLLELLMMIPVPSSQDDMLPIDQGKTTGSSSSNYLVPPPPRSLVVVSTADSDDDDDEDSDSEEDDDGDESSVSSDDSDSRRNSKKQQRNQQSLKKKRKKKKNDDGGLLLPYQQIRAFRREYQRAWLALLRLPLSIGALKRALNFIPQYVLDFVNHPLRFADFFMQAYGDNTNGGADSSSGGGGGLVGVLALDGLFQLITQYDLEYPNFYKQLYKLVTSRVMHVKYRSRFFDLLNRCLVRNEMLPAHVVAAFIKRLTRCAISSPPPAILFILALVSNLIRKHPECSCLIHRNNNNNANKKLSSDDGDDDKTTTFDFEDGYDAEQDDPVKSNALQSSLWELTVLERHYYPAVATLAKSIGTTEEIKAPSYNVMGDFVQHTYSSLFDQERKKYNNQQQHDMKRKSSEEDNHDRYNAKKRKASKTALVYTEPTSLFTETDVFASFLSL